MANVHTIRDFQQSGGGGGGPNYSTSSIAVGGAPGEDGRLTRPKCIDLIFPDFSWHSFILCISLVQVIVFIASLILGSYALTPNEYSLNKMGASYGPPLARGQIWRLVTPLFLHGSFWHILFNVFFQMRMGFPLERQYGLKQIAGIYFICGICGNLFSVALAPCKVAVGASTAGFGLIGLQMAEIALTWHIIQRKEQVIFNIAFFLMMSVLISIGPNSVVDWRGHAGGFIAGFALGVLYNETLSSRPAWYKTGKSVASIGLVGLIASTLAVIFAIPMEKRGC